ncbi:sensor histidine kinase [Maledivibacter halophilus]|uniref:histidine kinase n=1 Tax=Maledivibacter halophilus TaxID=36842 RepID=A0A1T5IGS1_9FIRM|nr:ATP-binding protein [Maledivibacter halophilus]SKC38347.1 two-component system, sensor histidine kinase YcbA [Maledivibacter halophilus]
MSKFKKLILGVIIVTLSSQFYIDMLFSDFRFTCAIIALGSFLFLNRDISPIIMSIIVSISIYIWRSIILFIANGFIIEVTGSYIPEIFFYIVYGLVLFILIRKKDSLDIGFCFFVTLLSDFSANIIEISIRIIYYNYTFYFNMLIYLLVVALIRSIAILIILIIIKYYRMLLLTSEHEKRYRKLLWLTMILKSEMYWMSKNMTKVEEVMSDSYKLFEEIRDNKNPDFWYKRALKIASDVHEIKKEYQLVVRGVSEITENRYKDSGMYFKDISKILEEKMQNEIRHKNLKVYFSIKRDSDFYTNKHYQLMSIFRNLITNAFEALSKNKRGSKITLIHESLGDKHVFKVIDNGCGIDKEDLEFIFSPGFSTKIDYETGHINRGLGLSLVKDMVENFFKGKIEVESSLGQGTCFQIYIPKKEIEVNI